MLAAAPAPLTEDRRVNTTVEHRRDAPGMGVTDETFVYRNEITRLKQEREGHINHTAMLQAVLKKERAEADAMREALTESIRELDACQKVIHLAGGFDPVYVSGARAALKRAHVALLEKS